METHFLFCLTQLIAIISSYYLSPNTLTWDNAQLFCQNHCQSHLASIHSLEDQNEAIRLIMKEEIITAAPDIEINAWIGLRITIEPLTGTTTYEWSDGTDYDYQHILSHNDVSGTTHGRLLCTLNATTCPWDNIDGLDSNNEQIFLCNDCKWDVLSKYAIITQNKGNTAGSGQAALKCQDNFGTMIGSIHSDEDNNEAKYLCELINDGRACHIGLSDHNNFASEGIYVWFDGTTFDYGSNISGSAYPWAQNEPSGGSPDCVSIDNSENYLWRDSSCGSTINTICNKPSQLCYKNKWIVHNGNWTWQPNQCDLINFNENSIDYMTLNISNNQWRYMVFDYMFAIDWNSQNMNEKHAGIVFDIVSFNLLETFSYFVGLYINTNNSIVKTFLKQENQSQYVYSSNILFYNLSNYYSLRVEFDRNGIFTVKLNDNYGNYVSMIPSFDISNELPLNYYIELLSIKNINVSTVSKSLFINGKHEYIFTESPTSNPTKSPTKYPTTPTQPPTQYPTINPSKSPTKYPSLPPTYMPTKSPTNIPTITPTISPTLMPTKSPTKVGRVDDITTTVLDGTEDAAIQNDNANSSNIGVIIGISSGAFVIAIIAIFCFIKWHKSRKTNNETKQQIELCDVNNKNKVVDNIYETDPNLIKLIHHETNNDIIDSGVTTPRDLDDLIDKHDDDVIKKGEEKDDNILDDIVTIGEYEGTNDNIANDEFVIDKENNDNDNAQNDFENNLVDNGVGSDIMMDDIVNEMETRK